MWEISKMSIPPAVGVGNMHTQFQPQTELSQRIWISHAAIGLCDDIFWTFIYFHRFSQSVESVVSRGWVWNCLKIAWWYRDGHSGKFSIGITNMESMFSFQCRFTEYIGCGAFVNISKKFHCLFIICACVFIYWLYMLSLQWRHNGCDGVSNQQPHHCLLSRLFKRRQKNIKAPRHWLCAGISPGTGEFPAHMDRDAENVSIWWRHHGWQFVLYRTYVYTGPKVWGVLNSSRLSDATIICQ